MVKDVGFTGTQRGMTDRQFEILREALAQTRMAGAKNFHHGDCIGADVQAAEIARDLGYYIIGHPPIVNVKRAFFRSDYENPPLDYLDRNHAIVNSVKQMYATPKEREEVLRSGTWATIRYSRRTGTPIVVIEP